jgi:prepilin-type N-terminal cleavage/methylation domain-containing protein
MKRGERIVRNKKGFTLVELMIVVIIIGILTAVGVPLYMGYVKDAKVASAKAVIGTVVNAEKLYHQKNGGFVDGVDLAAFPNLLNIDVRDATEFWTIAITGADANGFTVKLTGVATTEYKDTTVELVYKRDAPEVWNLT